MPDPGCEREAYVSFAFPDSNSPVQLDFVDGVPDARGMYSVHFFSFVSEREASKPAGMAYRAIETKKPRRNGDVVQFQVRPSTALPPIPTRAVI